VPLPSQDCTDVQRNEIAFAALNETRDREPFICSSRSQPFTCYFTVIVAFIAGCNLQRTL
jgi:hypothetical protein